MKNKIIALTIALALTLSIPVFAFTGGWQGGAWDGTGGWGGGPWDDPNRLFDNTTFVAVYSDGSIDADFSVGSPTGTFTRVGGATKPATYYDQGGVIQTTTTTDLPRFTYGYYDATGWHKWGDNLSGLMIEGASTNLITKSNNVEDAVFTKTTITADNADAGSSSPDGTATAPSLTASAGNGTFLLAAGVTAQTYSVWIKRKTGTGTIAITADSGVSYDTVTITSDWGRFQVTEASAGQTCGIKIVTNADAVYVWGNQFENIPFASSFIPTTTAALTRNEEIFEGIVTDNRTPATESMVVKLAPAFPSGVGLDFVITDTDTKQRKVFFDSGSNDVHVFPNLTDTAGASVLDLINVAYTANQEITLGYSVQSTGNPNTAGFFDGAADGTDSNTDFTAPGWGTAFQIGADNGTSNNFYGTIKSIAFFSDVKTADEHLFLDYHDWLNCRFK